MTVTGAPAPWVPTAPWARALPGIVLIIASAFAAGDSTFATVISVKQIELAAIAAGVFQIAHAFRTKGWGGFLSRIVLGPLYLAFSLILLAQPARGALILTYFLGAVLFASRDIRRLLSFAHWGQSCCLRGSRRRARTVRLPRP